MHTGGLGNNRVEAGYHAFFSESQKKEQKNPQSEISLEFIIYNNL